MCQFIRLGLVQGEYDPTNTMLWRDWLYPYPMEGAAVVLIALILYPLYISLKKRCPKRWMAYAISFVANALTCSLIELAGGLMFNAQHQNWDYSDMPFNFMGQVCLQNAVAFGVAASLIAWYVYPALERFIARVKPATMNIVAVIVAIAGGILFSLYAIAPPDGIDLGTISPNAEVSVERKEADAILLDQAKFGKSLLKEMSETVAEAKNLTDEERAELQRQIEAAQAEFESMNTILEGATGEQAAAGADAVGTQAAAGEQAAGEQAAGAQAAAGEQAAGELANAA